MLAHWHALAESWDDIIPLKHRKYCVDPTISHDSVPLVSVSHVCYWRIAYRLYQSVSQIMQREIVWLWVVHHNMSNMTRYVLDDGAIWGFYFVESFTQKERIFDSISGARNRLLTNLSVTCMKNIVTLSQTRQLLEKPVVLLLVFIADHRLFVYC